MPGSVLARAGEAYAAVGAELADRRTLDVLAIHDLKLA
jgi:hypothetical protein